MNKKHQPFDIVNYLFLGLIAILCIFPFIYIFSVSLSDGRYVAAGEVFLFPKGINFETYKYIFNSPRLNVVQGLSNSFQYTIVGTIFSVIFTFFTAFALSRRRLRARYIIMLIFLFTWVFEAGIIPNYIVLSALGLYNNWWVMIIPGAINTFLLIIARSFLETLPNELEESAFIDGANDIQIMWKIFLPLSKPLLATISVFYAVGIWNSFLIPLIYLQDRELHPIQLVLYTFVIKPDDDAPVFENMMINGILVYGKNLGAAAIFLAVFPILFVYPFAQKYFTKGFLIGSIKG